MVIFKIYIKSPGCKSIWGSFCLLAMNSGEITLQRSAFLKNRLLQSDLIATRKRHGTFTVLSPTHISWGSAFSTNIYVLHETGKLVILIGRLSGSDFPNLENPAFAGWSGATFAFGLSALALGALRRLENKHQLRENF